MYQTSFPPPPYPEANSKGADTKVPPPQPQQSSQSHSNLFPPGKWKDLWAAILFYIHFIAVVGFASFSAFYLNEHGFTLLNDAPEHGGMPHLVVPSIAIGASVLSSVLLALLVLKLSRAAPEGMIKASFIGNIVMSVVFCLVLALLGMGWNAIYALIFALLAIVMFFLYRKHIPMSAIILKTVIDVLSEYPAMINVSLLAVVGQALHLVLLAVCGLGVAQMYSNMDIPQTTMSFISIFLMVSLYWTTQVIQNVALTTIAGVYASFYFISGSFVQRLTNPTIRSFKRAISWSFGSICFGSLLIALVRVMSILLVRFARSRNDLAGAILECLLRICEDLLRYFNYYAFIHVAIYGKPYIAAAKDVWHLLQTNGVLSIINDNIIGTFCFMASLSISVGCAILSFIAMRLYGEKTEVAVATAYISLLCGTAISYLVLEILQSGATTTMVCLAEDPGALMRTKPELYNKLAGAYSNIFYNWRYP